MKKLFTQRKEFSKAFNINSRGTIGIIPDESFVLEYEMLKEELDEYYDACMAEDVVEIVDAIGDMLYLIIGTATKHGISHHTLQKVMDEIHRSNMSKLHDGKVVKDENGKVSKPSTFSKPDLKGVLGSHI
ncbi:nucleoside triphosphate pyrophosphohydrolase family protein [bacterium]|nr:nucleoside triphosphate pyrophosphohydrolase family protein [bacterium]